MKSSQCLDEVNQLWQRLRIQGLGLCRSSVPVVEFEAGTTTTHAAAASSELLARKSSQSACWRTDLQQWSGKQMAFAKKVQCM